MKQKNVFGQDLKPCSSNPMTGFFRDSYCHTCDEDQGVHTVCIILTKEFLAMSKYLGNDLSTPKLEFGFPGLKPGDRWCLCASRWKEAFENDYAPMVDLEATNLRTLEVVELEKLKMFSVTKLA
jgi:uncharacterized protein (DUF2237 family)